MTGRTDLTFQEAVESEAAAQSSLESVSVGLQRAMLYLTQVIDTTKFNDICHFLWAYTSSRYFVDEEVEVMHHNEKKKAKIVKVIPPHASGWDSLPLVNFGMDASSFKYDVKSVSGRKEFRMICPADRVIRPKGNLTKDRVKLFMKQHVNTFKRGAITEVKEESVTALKLDQIQWQDVFAGPTPCLDPEDESLPTRIRQKHRGSSGPSAEKMDRRKQNLSPDKRSKPGPKGQTPEEKKLRLEEQRKRQNEKKKRDREKAREAKLKEAKQQAEWSRKRDDLECDDLKPLPSGIPVQCDIPNPLFGDALMVMEFYHNFDEFFDLKEIFPHGFTFDLLQKVLCHKSIKSPISDLIRITLATIFCLQEEEDAEDEKKDESIVKSPHSDEVDVGAGDLSIAMNQAQKVQNLLKRIHGPKMSTIELTPLTVSEVLRLHFLTSGAPRARSIYRGWLSATEDPCLLFRMQKPHVIDKLASCSVFELEVDEKIGILNALIHQVMTFPAFREILEATVDRIVELRKEMRSSQAEFGRWERENAVRKSRKDGDTDGDTNPVTEPSPEETEEAMAVFAAEREKRLRTLEWEQSERRRQIREYESQYGVKPIGRDRAYRRYWLFNSISGLFIEQDDAFTGPCVRSNIDASHKSLSHSPTNNKENEFGERRSSSGSSVSSTHSGLNSCTGSSSSCLIHSHNHKIMYKWRFCAGQEDVQNLINSLNGRGFRESELMQALKTDVQLFEKNVIESPISKLNTDIPSDKRENARLVYYKASMTGMSHIDKVPNVAMKLMFLDHLSSFEEQLFASGISFRANSSMSREQWKSYLQGVDAEKEDFIERITKALHKLGNVIPSEQMRGEWQVAKWEECLDDTTSVSRLFFLLNVLESKIEFPQNVSPYCRVCRKKKDAERMLICDSCNGGHHTYCVKPPLDDVPIGKWFCPKCKQVPKVPKSPRKPVNVVEDDDVDELCTIVSSNNSSSRQTSDDDDADSQTDIDSDNEEELCAVCASADDDPDAECIRCNRKYHFSCHVPKIPINTRNWTCFKCVSIKSSQSKRKDIAVDEVESERRSKRTRVALKTTDIVQTQASGAKVRTSARSTRHSDDDGYNFLLCDKILEQLRQHDSSWPFLKRPTSRSVSNLGFTTIFLLTTLFSF